MVETLAKWTSGIAALCLLCCAAPLAVAFLGGGGVAASASWFGKSDLRSEAAVLVGVAIMAVALWQILRRRRLTGPACAVKLK